MNCLPCFQSKKSEEEEAAAPAEEIPVARPKDVESFPPNSENNSKPAVESTDKGDEPNPGGNGESNAKTFTFRELASATKNFRQETLIGEGGFGRVFKGTLQGGQVVAVKQLDRSGTQGNKEFLVEVLMLTLLKHPNLVNLIGYCADGEQRILVYEYLPTGCLEDHLIDLKEDQQPLDWNTRMKIAQGAAQGLEYLHEKANPPIIYRDLKTANILLDQDFNPRLSDYGLAKLAGGGNTTHITPRVMGTYGHCAPEYERSGELSLKSDVYSYGVVLLELITGRRAVDTTRPADEQNLVAWAQPIFRDPKRFPEMADPLLKKRFPVTSLNQVVGVAAMCLQEEPSVRPLIGDVVAALSFLVPQPDEPIPSSPPAPTPTLDTEKSNKHKDKDSSDDEDQESSSSEEDEHSSDNDDGDSEDDEQVHDNKHGKEVADDQEDDRASSDYGYGSMSGSSENEDEHGGTSKKSGKWGSTSRRKSKVRSSSSRGISSSSKRKSKVKFRSQSTSTSSSSSSSKSSRSKSNVTREPPQPNASVKLRDKSIGKSRKDSTKSRSKSNKGSSSNGSIEFSLRQQSSAKSDRSFGEYSSHSSNEESEGESDGSHHDQSTMELIHEIINEE